MVLNALNLHEKLRISAPRFDETRHAGVCSEVCPGPWLYNPHPYSCLHTAEVSVRCNNESAKACVDL
jgi:hypothetical protein